MQLMLLAPAMLVLVVFHLGAIGFNVGMSFTDWRLGSVEYAGAANYSTLLTSEDLLNSLLVTAYYVVGTVTAVLLIALPTAYYLNYWIKHSVLCRTLVFLPYVVPTVATALLWIQIFGNSRGSLANTVLGWFGLPPQRWLTDGDGILEVLGLPVPHLLAGPSPALVILILLKTWTFVGFAIVILMGGLTTMDDNLVEAARIDGAGELKVLWYVVRPAIAPTVTFVVITTTIFSLRELESIFVMTNGGPDHSTETLAMLLVRQFYRDGDLSLGATTTTVLLVIVFAVTAMQLRQGRRSSR